MTTIRGQKFSGLTPRALGTLVKLLEREGGEHELYGEAELPLWDAVEQARADGRAGDGAEREPEAR